MKEPTDFEEVGPGMRRFELNSAYAHWATLHDLEETMLPRRKPFDCERVGHLPAPLPPGVEWDV